MSNRPNAWRKNSNNIEGLLKSKYCLNIHRDRKTVFVNLPSLGGNISVENLFVCMFTAVHEQKEGGRSSFRFLTSLAYPDLIERVNKVLQFRDVCERDVCERFQGFWGLLTYKNIDRSRNSG